MKSDDGKIISFNCKLCECRFNDPNAKDMHMKGRRHRFAYKKKVNPDLVVDPKPSLKQRKMAEEKLRRQHREEYSRRREDIHSMGGPMGPMGPMVDEEMLHWEERRRYEEECDYMDWHRRYGRGPAVPPMSGPYPRPLPMMMYPNSQRRPDSSDDKHVAAHHSAIYPKSEELQAVRNIVSNTEKALKFVSDALAEANKKSITTTPATPVTVNPIVTPTPTATATITTPATPTPTPTATVTPAPNSITTNTTSTVDTNKKDDSNKKKTVNSTQKEDGSDGELFSFQKEKEDTRILRGVMRVGNLAKELLLTGDNHVCLVVLCLEKPTK